MQLILDLAFNVAGIAIMGGIFYRLGSVAMSLDGLARRVTDLEAWRERLPFKL